MFSQLLNDASVYFYTGAEIYGALGILRDDDADYNKYSVSKQTLWYRHFDIQRPIVTTISHGNVAYSSSNQTPAFVLATLSVFINSSFATYIILAYAVFYVLDFQLPNVACFTKLSLKKVTTTTTTKRYQTQSMQAVVTGSQCGTVSQT